jgi:hypothetical protein
VGRPFVPPVLRRAQGPPSPGGYGNTRRPVGARYEGVVPREGGRRSETACRGGDQVKKRQLPYWGSMVGEKNSNRPRRFLANRPRPNMAIAVFLPVPDARRPLPADNPPSHRPPPHTEPRRGVSYLRSPRATRRAWPGGENGGDKGSPNDTWSCSPTRQPLAPRHVVVLAKTTNHRPTTNRRARQPCRPAAPPIPSSLKNPPRKPL